MQINQTHTKNLTGKKRNSLFVLLIAVIVSLGFTIPKDSGNEIFKPDVITNPDKNLSQIIYNTLSDSTIGFAQDSTGIFNPSSLDSSALDSVVKIDSLKIDSTARLEYFKFQRTDNDYVELEEKKKSSFFAYPSTANLTRTVELDSSGQYVYIKEKIAGQEEKVYLKMKLEDYVNLKMKLVNREQWEKIGYKYQVLEEKNDLGELISDITNIEIPLPSAGFLSIFGPNIIKLRINGSVDIHGAWRNESTDGLTASRLGNSRNEPDFSQQVQISVNGTIGDKLKINADWNTERTFEYENQLKIVYDGYDDEIVKKIEAGNVSLQTSSLVGGSEALFGIKSQFQFGPLSLTALASQKKGEVTEVNLSGGSEKKTFDVHAYEYSENHYFLHSVYANTEPAFNFFENYYGNPSPVQNNNSLFWYVKDIEVWKSTTGIVDKSKERQANAYMDINKVQREAIDAGTRDSTQTSVPGESVIGTRFVPLIQGMDYIVNEYTGVISFITQIQRSDVVAAAFRIEGPTVSAADDIIYGEFTKDLPDKQLVVLKLIKPKDIVPGYKEAWSLQLRNIYPLKGGRDIKQDGFLLDINYRVEGQEPRNDIDGKKLLELFGLDKRDASGNASPDGLFDFESRTIITKTGEIIFPKLKPFSTETLTPLGLVQYAYDDIYDTTKTFAQQNTEKDKFLISGEYSASVTSTYSIGFNVVENSVRVQLNGRELKEGVDYVVDYNIGQVTIRNDAALVPGADLKISYEQNDLFSLASKTLLGLRGVYEFDKKTRLGFSFLNLNQKTLSDKVRIGEEPLSNTIYGVDFETDIDLPFITKGLDKIISTRAMSGLNVKGEFAYMNPDPNTKKSTISTDNDNSIAYIDDFEGAKRSIPIGVSYTGWKDLSPPFIGSMTELDSLMAYKAKAFWFNILPSDVDVNDIWPDKRASRQDQQVTVLDFVYRPGTRGMYNNNPKIEENLNQNWGGMMKALSQSASNLVEENIEFLEFWIKPSKVPKDSKLFIDIGQISEDVIPNGRLDTEDPDNNDNLENDSEDRGLDFVANANETGTAPGTDKAGDDFKIVSGSLVTDDYLQINGTEGNAKLTDIGRFPDSEDLNRNFNLDRLNSYFRYEIPLDTNMIVNPNPFIGGGGGRDGAWYLFKIPLKDFVDRVGDPSLQTVEFIRLFTTGTDEEVHIRIAEMNFVGNQWQENFNDGKIDKDDPILTISEINIEDNPEYITPPGVKREKDRSKPDEEVYKNEQSLKMLIEDLPEGDAREAIKYLFRPLDVFNYKEMKLFIRGDKNYALPTSISYYQDSLNYGAEVYFRFGSDKNNYYEYRQPLRFNTKAGSDGWDEIAIKFDELTAIKELRGTDSLSKVGEFRKNVPGREGHQYGVLGNPTLTRVAFFSIGIVNPGVVSDSTVDLTRTVSGELWVNELRVLGADDTPGWAYSIATTFKLADLMTVSYNTRKTDPYFHKLNDRFGSRKDDNSWALNANLDVLKLIPVKMEGSNIKVNYSHSESFSKPLYKPGTDILVEAAAEASSNPDSLRRETEVVNIKDTWALQNIKLKIPTKAWYIDDTFNNITLGFTYNKSFSRTPTASAQKSWVWDAKSDYSLNLGKNNFFYPADIPLLGEVIKLFEDYRNGKFYYTPQAFNANLSARRNWNYTQTRTKDVLPIIQRDFTASRGGSFNWLFTEGGLLNLGIDYTVDVTSSLAHILAINEVDRPESEIWKDIFGSAGFGRDNNYQQSFTFKTAPALPSLFGLNKYLKIDFGYRVTYNWKNNFQQEDLGRSASYSSSLNTGLNIRLQSIMDPLFGEDKTKKTQSPQSNFGQNRNNRNQPRTQGKRDDEDNINKNPASTDSLALLSADSLDTGDSKFMQILGSVKYGIKYMLFDYEQISFNFNQSNQRGGGGLAAEGTGFSNFWGVRQKDSAGPNRLFMLGLSNDLGMRAPGGTMQDNFSQKNNFDFKTSRPLWEGAKVDINWKIGWGFNRNTTLRSDSTTGEVIITNVTSTGSIDRSFFSMPISFFNSNLKRVNELYNPEAEDQNKNLAEAFSTGLESLPLLSSLPFLKDVVKYVPRPNWRLSWAGLEKLPIFEGFAKRVRLDHGYSSSFTEGWKVNPDGDKEIQSQKINYGFNPLAGLDIQFDELWGGNFNASAKYIMKTNYDLGVATKNITESLSRDISLTASFSKSGFDIPLFGLALKNDIEISFSYTFGNNSVIIYQLGENFDEKGKPQDGTTRTTLEPRIRYVMSSRVTLSLFYKRSSVAPEGASRIPATTTNEAGLDVHISIQ